MVLEALPLVKSIVNEFASLIEEDRALIAGELEQSIASVDGDIVQALTAVQKRLLSNQGSRDLSPDERDLLGSLLRALLQTQDNAYATEQNSPLERSISVLNSILYDKNTTQAPAYQVARKTHFSAPSSLSVPPETFSLKDFQLPRLFSGLWQLSSPSWGSASQSQMMTQFVDYVSRGFTAFDMADHYGDAEVIFGQLRESLERPENIFGATKYCVFHKTAITSEVVRANVTERCRRMSTDKVDLLQFHWQDYNDHQYIQALQLLQQDERVQHLGLCNFDTKRLQEVVQSGIDIVTNQVQFSLIDARPRFKMGEVCERNKIKLLTYGSLCGGFLAEKWLGKPEPQLFGADTTPSQRKYFEMIQTWGDWELFQILLQVLKRIATKHGVSVSNVATRWVLDFSYVGAVIVGARMGVSEHTEENLKTYGWRLDSDDRKDIEMVLEKSRREEVFAAMGDCGSEYR